MSFVAVCPGFFPTEPAVQHKWASQKKTSMIELPMISAVTPLSCLLLLLLLAPTLISASSDLKLEGTQCRHANSCADCDKLPGCVYCLDGNGTCIPSSAAPKCTVPNANGCRSCEYSQCETCASCVARSGMLWCSLDGSCLPIGEGVMRYAGAVVALAFLLCISSCPSESMLK